MNNEGNGRGGDTTGQGTTQEGTNVKDEWERAIVRTGQLESYSLQLNTAVFALFVKPKRSAASSPLLVLLDTKGLAVAARHVLERGWDAGGMVKREDLA